ncbi:MAG TPA: alpha/beta hydrolase-fold protein, partial [Phycisphaerae bacterium]
APDLKKGRIVLIPPVSASGPAIAARELYVYLPAGYDAKRTDGYPVAYMHDGQNLWDDPTEPFGHGGWQVNETADRLIASGKVRPFIVVGIPNSPERMKEYAPGRSIFDDSDHPYLQYIVRDVKPLIDRTFHTSHRPEDTTIMGSSMGAILSLQAALLHPDIFGAAGCLSPAFQFKDPDGKSYADLIEKIGHLPVRLYLDHGTAGAGGDGADTTGAMVKLLKKTGWQSGEDQYFIHEGAEHNERAWRQRLERPLEFLIGRDPDHPGW